MFQRISVFSHFLPPTSITPRPIPRLNLLSVPPNSSLDKPFPAVPLHSTSVAPHFYPSMNRCRINTTLMYLKHNDCSNLCPIRPTHFSLGYNPYPSFSTPISVPPTPTPITTNIISPTHFLIYNPCPSSHTPSYLSPSYC